MAAPADRPAGRVYDAALELLDRQLIDADGVPAGNVDDLELAELADGSVVVTAILSGPGALAPRLGGRLGTTWTNVFRRLHPAEEPEPARVSFGVVRDIDGAQVRLTASRHHLDTNRLEHWVRHHVIERIPGAGRAPE